MKRFWVKVVPWEKDLVTAALEAGAEAVIVPEGFEEKVRELGRIRVVSPEGDLKPGEDVFEVEIRSKKDEEEAARLGKANTVIVQTTDWTVIPLENLVAQSDAVLAEVRDAGEARTALGVLEKGVAGVVLSTGDAAEVGRVAEVVRGFGERLDLVEARVTGLRILGMGDRVCVDTCTSMGMGEGMLVGNSSSGLFLVHAESVETPYVAPRPFRVNAGAVHAYARVPGGKTRYLSELASGDEVLLVNWKGACQTAVVGRSKVEKRPLMLVEAEAEGGRMSLVLQNAETIRLTSPEGKPLSVASLKEGDRVLACVEKGGRHFGMAVEETIEEK